MLQTKPQQRPSPPSRPRALRPERTPGSRPGRAVDAIPVLKALSDPTRLGLVECLLGGELCVGDLTAALDLRQPRVSHHLAILRRVDLVRDRRAGKRIFYRLNPAWLDHGPPPRLDLGPLRLEFKT